MESVLTAPVNYADAHMRAMLAAQSQPLQVLPVAPDQALQRIAELEAMMLRCEQEEIPTEHLFHAGMYARTLTVPPLMVVTGSLTKCPTTLIVSGTGYLLAGDALVEFDGYRVIAGSAGRKQVLVTRSEVKVTMIFSTKAKTVEEAEAEFTNEHDRLLSRKQDANTVVMTGE